MDIPIHPTGEVKGMYLKQKNMWLNRLMIDAGGLTDVCTVKLPYNGCVAKAIVAAKARVERRPKPQAFVAETPHTDRLAILRGEGRHTQHPAFERGIHEMQSYNGKLI